MAVLERSSDAASLAEINILTASLLEMQRQFELADVIENPIERFFIQDALLEQFDQVQAEIDFITVALSTRT